MRHDIDREIGQGWMDLYQVNHGILVGRSAYDLRPGSSKSADIEGLAGYFGLLISLSGTVSWKTGSAGDRLPACAVVLCPSQAPKKRAVYEWKDGCPFLGVGIMIPDGVMAEMMAESGPGNMFDPEIVLMDRGHGLHRQGVHTAHALLHASTATAVGRLHVESLALGLVALLAGQRGCAANCPLPYRQRVAVDEVRHILHEEFAAPHTIASLARRAHLNECYLKSAFRCVTGRTIAAYLRGIRMARAREAIESGRMNVLQAGLFVGYTSQSMFSAAFKAHYGFAPSCLK